jgi:monoamine oxidase
MERLFDVPASAVVDYVEQDWGAEPWTGGCPVASMGAGVLSVFADSWRATIGRIHWAGTETARHWNGYLEGALESAERVASEVAHFMD